MSYWMLIHLCLWIRVWKKEKNKKKLGKFYWHASRHLHLEHIKCVGFKIFSFSLNFLVVFFFLEIFGQNGLYKPWWLIDNSIDCSLKHFERNQFLYIEMFFCFIQPLWISFCFCHFFFVSIFCGFCLHFFVFSFCFQELN